MARGIGGYTFPEGISPKVNVIAQMKFENVYYDVVIRLATSPQVLHQDDIWK